MSGRWVTAASAGGLLALSGLIYGLGTDRWGMSQARASLAARISAWPTRIGDWTGEDLPSDPRVLRYAEADALLQRRYVRHGEGKPRIEATLILMSGRPAPLSVHTPDICFANSGYRMEGEPRIFVADSQRGDSFWYARFTKPSDPLAFQVYWAWSDGGPWVAADDARLEFSRSPALCKLYLICPLARTDKSTDSDPARQLIADLLPDLRRCLAMP